MYNLSSIFFEFREVIELLKKKDFPSQIKLHDPETNNTIEIFVSSPNNSDINFTIKFYKNKNQISITQLNKASILYFQNQYQQYITQVLSLETTLDDHLKKNQKPALQGLFSFFKLPWKLINEFKIKQFLFFPLTMLNIYSIDGYNDSVISRTTMKSFDRINIVNYSYAEKGNNLLHIHNLNIVLIDYIFQNRIKLSLKMLTLGTRFFIRFIRLYLFIIWLVSNTTIIFMTGAPNISEINLSEIFQNIDSLYNLVILPYSGFVIVNIIIPVLGLLAPRIIRSLIISRIKKRIKYFE
jgi:hypothetical protein